jgi:hypothetical protein
MPRDLSRTPLFHITDLENLASIASGDLLSDVDLAKAGGPKVGIGYDNIKRRRMFETQVECADNRYVGEFVPFYFCPRSVMLYTVNKGNSGRPIGCQRTILHLVTTVAAAISTNQVWAYSDGNAGTAYPSFFNDINTLDKNLNWVAINETANWSSVKTQKAAEFLVANSYPWELVRLIGCYNEGVAKLAQKIIEPFKHQPLIRVRPDWYY